jgi:hypothetical protein
MLAHTVVELPWELALPTQKLRDRAYPRTDYVDNIYGCGELQKRKSVHDEKKSPRTLPRFSQNDSPKCSRRGLPNGNQKYGTELTDLSRAIAIHKPKEVQKLGEKEQNAISQSACTCRI